MNGSKLRVIRQSRNMSQESLAEKANITRNYINSIENNKKRPSIALLERLANVLECSVSDFF